MKTRQVVLIVLAVLVAQGLALAKHKNHYVFNSFDPPGSVFTVPVGINNNGLIGIQYVDAEGVWHSVLLQNGRYKVIDLPGATNTLDSAPNDQGQDALGYFNPPDNYMHPALYWKGHYKFLPDAPGELNTAGSAINARGHISGVAWSDNFTIVHGYLWDGRTYHIYDHPDSDVHYTIAIAINNRDQIAGWYNTSDGVIHGYLKDRDRYTDITVPGAPNTDACGINNWGAIVGSYGEAVPGPVGLMGSHAFMLWKGIYSTLDYPGAEATFPMGINDRNQIVGVYQDTAGTFHGYFATPRYGK